METATKIKEDLIHQRLPDWSPTLNISRTNPVFLLIGILFIVIGGIILYIFQNTIEFAIDYTDCKSKENANVSCADIIGTFTNRSCTCEIQFDILTDIPSAVYVYYALTNFFQNHRRYLVSRDNYQLLGKLSLTVSPDCKPYDYVFENGKKKPIAPCGAIANSMFSDRLRIYSVNRSSRVPLLRRGIAWPNLKKVKYRNPTDAKNLKTAFQDFAKPPAWRKNIWELDPVDPENNAFENEDFIVWMQPATLSNFKKLYRRIDHTANDYKNGLPKGRYMLIVEYFFPVKVFKGTKSFVLANASVMGTRNTFLGKAYIFVGIACIIVSIVFYVLHVRFKKIA